MKMIGQVVVLVLALHAIGVVGFVAWLASGDRLDGQRIDDAIALFQETATERDQRLAEEEADRIRLEEEAEAEALKGEPPLRPGEWIEKKLEQEELGRQRLSRLREEAASLRASLDAERRQLDAAKAAFVDERDRFNAMRQVIADTEGDGQFAKTLDTYSSIKPAAAKDAMGVLIAQGGIDQVVVYLNAMENRTRSKIVTEFHKDEPAMASDLLERLRVHGLETRAAVSQANAEGP